MKVTASAVYKLSVQSECGCASVAEFSDAGYRSQVGEAIFTACASHKDTDVATALGTILKEVGLKEATDRQSQQQQVAATQGADPAAPGTEVHRPLPAVARRTGTTPEDASSTGPTGRPTLRAVAAGNGVPSTPLGTAKPAGPAKAGTETRTPLPGAVRREPGGTPRVVGGASGVRRADPNEAMVKRGLAMGKAASKTEPMSLDIGDEVDEDSRVTNLLETSGVLDTDEFDEA